MVEIIAEVGNAHDGSLGLAHAHVDAAHRAGANTIKFQCHIADAESTASEPWRIEPQWRQDASRYDYWKRLEFSEAQWATLAAHAKDAGLGFLASPFSIQAFELLQRLGVDRWKVASGEVTHNALLRRIADTGQPVLLSTGLGTKHEIETAVYNIFPDNELTVMYCVTTYPTPPEKINIEYFHRDWWGFEGGLGVSDHSGTIYPGLLAAERRFEAVEVHLKLAEFGPDAQSSLTEAQLKQLVDGVQFIESMPEEDDDFDPDPDPELRRIFMTRDSEGRKIGA